MRAITAALLFSLTACSPDPRPAPPRPNLRRESQGRRYEITSTAKGVFLLDNRRGRVWEWDRTDFVEVTPNALAPHLYTNSPAAPEPTNAFQDLIPTR